jgi:hypothetical protein
MRRIDIREAAEVAGGSSAFVKVEGRGASVAVAVLATGPGQVHVNVNGNVLANAFPDLGQIFTGCWTFRRPA